MILINFLIFLNTAFASPDVNNNVFVETQLNVGMRVHGLQYKEWRSGLFNVKKNSVHQIDFNSFSFSPNGVYTESKNLEYKVETSIALQKSTDELNREYQKAVSIYNECRQKKDDDRECNKPFNANDSGFDLQKKIFRTTNVNINYSKNGPATTVKLNIVDSQVHKKFVIGGGANRIDLASSSDQISGSIKVGYRLPENTWAVVFQRKSSTGVFSLPKIDSAYRNVLNNRAPLKGNGSYIIWGKPGTTVYKEFVFDKYSQGSNVDGSFEYTIYPIDLSPMEKLSLSSLVKQLGEIKPYRSNISFESHLSNVKVYLYLMSRPDLLEKLMTTLTTNQIVALITGLSEVSYGIDFVAYNWDIKAGSSIISSELAMHFLKQITPFCRLEKIVLPYTQSEVQIVGLKLANFFLEKAKARLEMESFKHYQTLIHLLSSYNGKTFSEVRLNKKEALRIQKSYEILTNTVNMRLSTFKAAHDEIRYIYEKFGSMGAPGSGNAEIFDLIKDLNGLDSSFNNELLNFLRQFQEGNHSVISTRNLSRSLSNMSSMHKRTLNAVDDKIKIAGFSSKDGSSFIQTIQAISIHNVEILTEPLEESFETFRSTYFDEASLKSVVEQIQGCVR